MASEEQEVMSAQAHRAKRIAPAAYDALVDALAVIFWNKQPFERFVRLTLRDHPAVLAAIDFGGLKRQAAGDLVMRLASDEDKYQDVTLDLMLGVARMDHFANLESQADAAQLVTAAQEAVQALRAWTEQYGELAEARERLAAQQQADAERSATRRSVSAVLEELKSEFLAMYTETDAQKRGRALEPFLNRLFSLFDLAPRNSFKLDDEQVDGAFTFSTDDYVLEAKWENHPASREDVDVLAQKVLRKGRNTLGLFLAVSGFSEPALRAHSNKGGGLIFMEGTDLYAVLDEQMSLVDALEAKRRHLSETGLPLLLVSEMLRNT
jgi:hypothetical protein